MKEKKNLRAIQAQRFLRYSIRKFSVGVASVAIASGLAVLTGANVQAEEVNATTPATVNTVPTEKPTTEAATTPAVENATVEKVDKSSLDKAITRLETSQKLL